jgi:hypothetical protein
VAPADPIEASLAHDVHFVYYAKGLFHEAPPPGVRAAPPLEEGLQNPARVAKLGDEHRHHGVVAMLGARWHRDISAPAELFFDPDDPAQLERWQNKASALAFVIATGEHALKLIITHRARESRPGAHLIYTLITKDEARARTFVERPELLFPLVARTLDGHEHDLTGLALARPLHHAHPSDLSSDANLQRAFRTPRTDFLRRLNAAYKAATELQAAARAQLALLELTKATQRAQATFAFLERRDLHKAAQEVDAERKRLGEEKEATDGALVALESRDAQERDAARRQLAEEIERARQEREATRAELARRTEELAAYEATVAALEASVVTAEDAPPEPKLDVAALRDRLVARRAQARAAAVGAGPGADRARNIVQAIDEALGEACALGETVAALEADNAQLVASMAAREAALAEAEEIVQDLYRQMELLSKLRGGEP